MLEVSHLIHFFSSCFGLILLYILFTFYKNNKRSYLRSYIYVIFGFTIITFTHTLEAFFKITRPEYLLSNEFKIVFLLIEAFLSIIRIYIAYHLVYFILDLVNLKWKPSYKRIPVVLSLIVILLFFLSIFLVNYQIFQKIPGALIHLLFFLCNSFFLVLAFYRLKKIKSSNNKTSKLQVIHFLFYFTICLVISRILVYIDIFSENTQMLVISLIILTFFILNTVFFKKMFVSIYPTYNLDKYNYFDHLFVKYKITKREQEVIKLVCEGKPNKEIAEILFITPVTVRDHISKIFRKTNVKRRIQLVNLFRNN